MERDPESNAYSSNGPQARAKKTQDTVKRLERKVEDLEERVASLEREGMPSRPAPDKLRPATTW